MDALDTLIKRKTEERANIRAELDALEAQSADIKKRLDNAAALLRDIDLELKSFEHAARLRPPAGYSIDDGAPKRAGRQPGALSKKWKQALADVVALGNQFIDHNRFYLVTGRRTGLTERAVRERVRSYVKTGILEENEEGKIRVSEGSIGKLGLNDPEALANAPDDDDGDDDTYPRNHGEG